VREEAADTKIDEIASRLSEPRRISISTCHPIIANGRIVFRAETGVKVGRKRKET
jgi:hypothetical protein